MFTKSSLAVFSLGALVLVLEGCGGGADLGATVEGCVTLDGNPVPTGQVVFHPAGKAPVAIGKIQPNGSYRLRAGTEEGLVPGDYQVTVVATKPTSTEMSNNLQEDLPLPERITPARYGSVETSKLQFVVKPGSNTIDIPLVSSPK